MSRKRRSYLIVSILLLGLAGCIIWWWRRPPTPEMVARWATEAISNGDAERLWNLACDTERERLSREQLQRVLAALHQEFPYLRDCSRQNVLFNKSVALAKYLRHPVYDHPIIFCYHLRNGRLEPLPAAEVRTVAAAKVAPKGVVRLRIFVFNYPEYGWTHPLVVRSLVHTAIVLAMVEGRSVLEVLDRVFLQNGVRVAFYEPRTGRVRRIDAVKQITTPDGRITYLW